MTSAARPLPLAKYNARAKKKQLMELVYDFIDEQLNADWTEAVKQYELLCSGPNLFPLHKHSPLPGEVTSSRYETRIRTSRPIFIYLPRKANAEGTSAQ